MRSLGSRPAFAVLGVVIVTALLIGSHHVGAPTNNERIANLESIIKCPSCADLTIAQSDSSTAAGLRKKVAHFVAIGESDSEIEAYIVNTFGESELLAPHGVSGGVAIGVPLVAFAVAAVVISSTLVRRGRAPSGGSAVPDPEDLAIVSAALADRREPL